MNKTKRNNIANRDSGLSTKQKNAGVRTFNMLSAINENTQERPRSLTRNQARGLTMIVDGGSNWADFRSTTIRGLRKAGFFCANTDASEGQLRLGLLLYYMWGDSQDWMLDSRFVTPAGMAFYDSRWEKANVSMMQRFAIRRRNAQIIANYRSRIANYRRRMAEGFGAEGLESAIKVIKRADKIGATGRTLDRERRIAETFASGNDAGRIRIMDDWWTRREYERDCSNFNAEEWGVEYHQGNP